MGASAERQEPFVVCLGPPDVKAMQPQTCHGTKRPATPVPTIQEAILGIEAAGTATYTPGASMYISIEWEHCAHSDTRVGLYVHRGSLHATAVVVVSQQTYPGLVIMSKTKLRQAGNGR